MSKKLIPKRDDIPEDQMWDLTPIFEKDDQWETLYHELEKKIQNYAKYRGILGESVILFEEALTFHLSVLRSVEKLHTHAHLKSDEDKSNQFYEGLYQRAISLHTRVAELSSFFIPEIQNLPDETVKNFLSDNTLNEYRFFFNITGHTRIISIPWLPP